ncbi:Myosin-binding protein 2 [Striga hermonthica]|uniref:Myosin-binding protein 2 n=1 Tax=Striga hermonthica TaxID=68872 RepID=A0A9N7R0C4_STRHE|nr:Myosin-binding protein 2 [Striga hermonthica]
MAANRFATLLHRNTNKITLILIYAVLEWILILLLLLNSLFSYLILKFAEFFGLKPPCPWCARIDHVFEPGRGDKSMKIDYLCEFHSKEISKLGFCSNHQKLVDSGEMCEGCLSSRPELEGSPRNFGLFEKVREFGKFQSDAEKVDENAEVCLNCSCCGVSLANNDKYSSYVLLKTSSWDDDVSECAQKENPVGEERDYEDNLVHLVDFSADLCDNVKISENSCEGNAVPEFESWVIPEFEENLEITDRRTEENGYVSVNEKEKEVLEEKSTLIMKDKSVQVCVQDDAAVDISPQHLEFFLDYSGHKLVPVELIDSVCEEHKIEEYVKIEGGDIAKDQEQEVYVESEVGVQVKEEVVVVESEGQHQSTFLDFDINEVPKYAVLDSMDIEEDENSLVFHAKGPYLETEEFDNCRVFPFSQWPLEEGSDVQEHAGAEREEHSDVQRDNSAACEEVSQVNNENEAVVSIGTEIPDIDITDEMQIQISDHTHESLHDDSLTSSANLCLDDDHGPEQIEEQMVETQSLSPIIDTNHMTNDEQWVQSEVKEVEEDKAPDTPTSTDSQNLERSSSLLEKRDSVAEESLDESVTSELDGPVTIESLKSALRTERKALQALYAELEEERSASAVATNQTMAMINRLQEEKAAMQMEALQYQRMMEEQSEYDQEALQLLNELMVKREKEKQELERELEVYRKKLMDYETREKLRVLGKSRDGSVRSIFSSASCSNAEDSDGLSIDLNQDVKEEDGLYSNLDFTNQSTPINAVVNLEESLEDFEDERLSILEQLKVLEEKLLTLDDANGQHFEDAKGIDNADENGHLNGEENGHLKGYPNGKHEKRRRIAGQNGKSLLPLFDAISDDNGSEMVIQNGFDSNGIHDSYQLKVEMENKKLAIEEEVDHLYERLQALEADREFLKHCISSLKKGDKGMDLLQEILQHLRDLRHVEFRLRNSSDGALI